MPWSLTNQEKTTESSFSVDLVWFRITGLRHLGMKARKQSCQACGRHHQIDSAGAMLPEREQRNKIKQQWCEHLDQRLASPPLAHCLNLTTIRIWINWQCHGS